MVLSPVDHLPKRLPARFYRTLSGREPVREWLRKLPVADRKIIGEDIKDVEFSWPVGMPLVRSLSRNLWEVRSSITDGRVARVIFCVDHGQMFLLHGFIKKTQKTPQRDIDLALNRRKGQEQ
ncbi:MAG: type II toxin-antitoxin system RelE/ParE family toxin [Terriglobia bacterium]|jgi:phage-related protein